MNFDIEVQTVQIFKCADGTEFNNQADAVAHNKSLKERAENEAKLQAMNFEINQFNNAMGYIDRNAKQKHTIISAFLMWRDSWDGQEVPLFVKEDDLADRATDKAIPVENVETHEEDALDELKDFHAAELEADPFYQAVEGTFEPDTDFDTETGEVYEHNIAGIPF